MSKIENIFQNVWLNILANFIFLFVVAVVGWGTGFFRTQSLDIQLLFIVIVLLAIVLLNLQILRSIHRVASPKKPPLVKAHQEPDTYLFLHGEWRKIRDPPTRDYLAHILGFRPGEDDIALKPKDEIDKLRKGPPLESINTYASRS